MQVRASFPGNPRQGERKRCNLMPLTKHLTKKDIIQMDDFSDPDQLLASVKFLEDIADRVGSIVGKYFGDEGSNLLSPLQAHFMMRELSTSLLDIVDEATPVTIAD